MAVSLRVNANPVCHVRLKSTMRTAKVKLQERVRRALQSVQLENLLSAVGDWRKASVVNVHPVLKENTGLNVVELAKANVIPVCLVRQGSKLSDAKDRMADHVKTAASSRLHQKRE